MFHEKHKKKCCILIHDSTLPRRCIWLKTPTIFTGPVILDERQSALQNPATECLSVWGGMINFSAPVISIPASFGRRLGVRWINMPDASWYPLISCGLFQWICEIYK